MNEDYLFFLDCLLFPIIISEQELSDNNQENTMNSYLHQPTNTNLSEDSLGDMMNHNEVVN